MIDTTATSPTPTVRASSESAEINADINSSEATFTRKPATREHILEATRTALVREGYENITTRCIAEIAGVNIATLHYHFGNKEALLREAMRHALARTEARMRDGVRDADSLEGALDRAFSVIWELMQERPGILRFDLAVRGFRDPSALAEVRQVYSAYLRLVLDLLTREYDPAEPPLVAPDAIANKEHFEAIARYMVAAVDGVVLQHTLTGDDAAARFSLSLIRRHVRTLVAEAKAPTKCPTTDVEGA